MNSGQLISLIIALTAGILIGVQTSINARVSTAAGAFTSGLMIAVTSGVVAFLALIVLSLFFSGQPQKVLENNNLWYVTAAGAIGVFVLVSIAFAAPRVGIVAGLSAIIAGQIVMALLADTLGWGVERIPLTLPRLVGVVMLVVGVILVLPRSE